MNATGHPFHPLHQQDKKLKPGIILLDVSNLGGQRIWGNKLMPKRKRPTRAERMANRRGTREYYRKQKDKKALKRKKNRRR